MSPVHPIFALALLSLMCQGAWAQQAPASSPPSAPPSAAPAKPAEAPKTPAQEKPAKSGASAIKFTSFEGADVKDWDKKAPEVASKWHDPIRKLLAVTTPVPPEIQLIVRKGMKVPAYCTGNQLHLSWEHIQRFPDDLGMVVHELCHIVQSYPPRQPGWLVEGIADYVRYYHYEPERGKKFTATGKDITWTGADWKRGYLPAAAVLDWAVRHGKPKALEELNALLKAGKYSDEAFAKAAGASPEELWKQLTESWRKPAATPPTTSP
jgi:hypothetical protein